MSKPEASQDLPARLLNDVEMIEACRERDFSEIFKLVKRAGVYPALIARRCELTPSRVGEVIKGQRVIKDIAVIERVADGLHIPGHMLGLMRRGWEGDERAPLTASLTAGDSSLAPTPDELWVASPGEDITDPQFATTLIESQLPLHYKSANYFGARQPLSTVVHHAQTIDRLLRDANGSTRDELLRLGSRIAEFLGWLYQDLGDFPVAGYWSDRSMEWAQEAADDHMQSYVLFRKSHQAASQANAERAIGLARAAQRVPNLTSGITALAVQQEATGYALQRNPRAALAKFDEAHEYASQSTANDPPTTLDTSYCTPTYVEIQRANCWIDLGEPLRAVQLFEDEIAALPQIYRNDRGVYLARLARAYAKAGEPEQGAKAATKALAIVTQTGSARTLAELEAVTHAAGPQRNVPAVATFIERFEIVRDRLAT
ncbi:tetratricopeptide repeat protein [Streptomyces sp. NPDC059991]|uniref:tetratricopeptide repeat protein n=1 Tax=Streptomyces sp. NPDC059991 TaxID=3347028 RepID=UPI0036C4C2B0